MALNDKFIIPNKNRQNFKSDLETESVFVSYWDDLCKKNPSKKECLVYCD